MAEFDILNPQVSVVAKGLEGKVITIYGNNATGKTKQATRFPRPFYMPIECGLNAIAGIPFLPINNWSDFKKINKQLTNPKTLDQVKEKYQTIIFDEVDAAAKYCAQFICDRYDSPTIAEGRKGFGLWTEYANEYWTEINKLIGAGFTVVFIAHRTVDEAGKVWPKGDKRALAPVIDNSDIVVYVESNGVDEKGKVIKSSGYMAETDKFFARSRFDYIDTYLPEFTAEALESAIVKAIEKQEKVEGIKAVSYAEQKATFTSEKLDYDELVVKCTETAKKISVTSQKDDMIELVEKHLGEGVKIKDAKKTQVEVLAVLLSDLEDMLKETQEQE